MFAAVTTFLVPSELIARALLGYSSHTFLLGIAAACIVNSGLMVKKA